MRPVYFISGLGADKRAFSLLDLSFCDPVFIDWIQPAPGVSLPEYAVELRKSIPDDNPLVVGVSFGGMLVTEMAKADPNVKGIIIASNKVSTEFPRHLRIGKFFPVYQWLPASFLKQFMILNRAVLGCRSTEQKALIRQIILDSNINFVRWAIGAILRWTNQTIPDNLIHIHGTGDKLLPYSLVRPNYSIEGGTHLMILEKPQEISQLLKKLIL